MYSSIIWGNMMLQAVRIAEKNKNQVVENRRQIPDCLSNTDCSETQTVL